MEVKWMEQNIDNKKKVIDRLSRAIGHLEAIRRMVEGTGIVRRCWCRFRLCAQP